MSFPAPQFPCNTATPYGTMPTPEPNRPMTSQQPQQSAYPPAYPTAYPQPPSQAYTPSYQHSYQHSSYQQSSYQPPSPAYPPAPSHTANSNFLTVPPPMSPYPQTPSSTYSHMGPHDFSRPGTPYSALSSTVVASDHSHGAYGQSRAPGVNANGPYCPEKPAQAGTYAPQEESHGSGCCIIM